MKNDGASLPPCSVVTALVPTPLSGVTVAPCFCLSATKASNAFLAAADFAYDSVAISIVPSALTFGSDVSEVGWLGYWRQGADVLDQTNGSGLKLLHL